jgi:hypothetical protein
MTEKKAGELRPKLIQIGKSDRPDGGGVFMLGTPPGTCEMCATAHKPEEPHNQQSLPWQYQFANKHGRWPTWADAIAHCPPEAQAKYKAFLVGKGVWSEPKENLKPEEQAAHTLMGSHLPSNKPTMEPGNIAPVTTVKIEDPPTVKVGQIWQGMDKRCKTPRLLEIMKIDAQGYAKCSVHNRKGRLARTWVRVGRFKPGSTGYKLVKDVP